MTPQGKCILIYARAMVISKSENFLLDFTNSEAFASVLLDTMFSIVMYHAVSNIQSHYNVLTVSKYLYVISSNSNSSTLNIR